MRGRDDRKCWGRRKVHDLEEEGEILKLGGRVDRGNEGLTFQMANVPSDSLPALVFVFSFFARFFRKKFRT